MERFRFVEGFEHARHTGEVADCFVEFLGLLDEIAVDDLGGRDGGLNGFVKLGEFFAAESAFFDEVNHVFQPGLAEPEFLLLKTAVGDAADEVIEPFPLHDPIERDLVAFFAVMVGEIGR